MGKWVHRRLCFVLTDTSSLSTAGRTSFMMAACVVPQAPTFSRAPMFDSLLCCHYLEICNHFWSRVRFLILPLTPQIMKLIPLVGRIWIEQKVWRVGPRPSHSCVSTMLKFEVYWFTSSLTPTYWTFKHLCWRPRGWEDTMPLGRVGAASSNTL